MDQRALLAELEPRAAELLERHLATAREWFPHLLVPWSRGRDFSADEQCHTDEAPVSGAARSALFVNLLTEDNLPHYFRTISDWFGRDDAWGTWTRRWTAEEGRHAIVIRDYLTVTRAIDPVALERARMTQVSDGVVPEPPSLADGLVYASLQELATRIAHHNTGRLLSDSVGRRIMTRVAADENLHHLFYRDLTTAALAIDPATVVPAIDRQVRHFAMPGTGIPDFARHARAIANAGVYDFAAHHEQILVPVLLRHWRVDRLQGLKATAEQARERLLSHIDRVGRIARRLVERRKPQPAT
ncbi:MAG: acyl-ACP desaturase [Actinomycetota bacterium]